MVWLFLIPSIPSVLGNFLLPLMLGARDLAFPRLNLASWYVYMAGRLLIVAAFAAGGVDTGWTFYTPFSTLFSNTHVLLTLAGVAVTGVASFMTGINFIVTVHTLRAPGLGWFRLPLFVWALYATSVILVLTTPVLATTLLLAAERLLGVSIFDPALGGDQLLFQHLFWFYSHPAVYIMVLPAMGGAAKSCRASRAARCLATARWPTPFLPSPCSAFWSGAQLLQLPTPMMGAAACLHPDQAWLQLGEKFHYLAALELLPQHRVAVRIDSMNLNQVFCQIGANCRNLHFGCPLRNVVSDISTLAIGCRF